MSDPLRPKADTEVQAHKHWMDDLKEGSGKWGTCHNLIIVRQGEKANCKIRVWHVSQTVTHGDGTSSSTPRPAQCGLN